MLLAIVLDSQMTIISVVGVGCQFHIALSVLKGFYYVDRNRNRPIPKQPHPLESRPEFGMRRRYRPQFVGLCR